MADNGRSGNGSARIDNSDIKSLTANTFLFNTHVFEQLEVGSDCVYLAVSTNSNLLYMKDVKVYDRTVSVSGDMADKSVQQALSEGRAVVSYGKEREEASESRGGQRNHVAKEELVKHNSNGDQLGI